MCTPKWTETRAVSNRGLAAVAERIAQIEAALPFPILGFDTDNGGELLNWHLVHDFGKRKKPIGFTRSRAYRKNDNAPSGTKELDPCAAVSRLRATGRRSSGHATGRSLSPGVELVPQFLLPRYEAPAHRVQRQAANGASTTSRPHPLRV